MRTTDPVVIIRNVSRVDKAVQERGWSIELARELALEMDVNLSTVYRYWEKCRRWTQRTMQAGDLDKWRAKQVSDLDRIRGKCEKAEDYDRAIKAIETQAKIIGTIAPLKADVRVSGAVAHVPVTTDTVALLTELHALAEQRASAIEATAVPVDRVEEEP